MKSYSNRFKEDWNFYTANRKKFSFCGEDVPLKKRELKGLSAKECFFLLDSTGKDSPCRHPRLLQATIKCKKSVNFHIKMWGWGYVDCFMGIPVYLAEFRDPPAWVEKALRKQVWKRV